MRIFRSGIRAVLAPLLIAVLVSCDSDPVAPRIEDTTFAPSLGVNLSEMTKTVSGLYIKNLVLGTGAAAGTGSRAYVYYTGWLTDGTEFDSAWPPDEEPIRAWIGSGDTVKGFAEGIRGMQVGGKRLIVVPPALGYGNRTVGPIPSNSILVFEIELVDVED
jgi:FKBP-type peptidyl-prolyl cis-trans isomerase